MSTRCAAPACSTRCCPSRGAIRHLGRAARPPRRDQADRRIRHRIQRAGEPACARWSRRGDVRAEQSHRRVALGHERQTLTLTSGEKISARLVIGANGVMGEMVGSAPRDQPLPFGLGRLRYRGRRAGRLRRHLLRRRPGASRRLPDAVPAAVRLAREPVRLSRTERSMVQAPARQSGRDHRGEVCRSLRGSPARCASKGPLKIRPVDLVATDNVLQARRRAGRRRVLDRLPGERHRRREGAARCRAALQRLRPGLARDSRHERGEDRAILRRSRTSAVPTRIRCAPRCSRSAPRSAKACCGPPSAGAILRARRRAISSNTASCAAAR